MTPDRYQQLEGLCHQALDKPAGERAAFVRTACAGDEALLRDLETLLASSEAADRFLEDPPGDMAAAVLQHQEDRSADQQTLSHYQLRSRLGAGGMGEVHLAQDLRLGRLVALKLLPRELAEDREQRRRLVVEAQAASTLNHPNIAQIYEIGQTDDGARFIAMEYVPGRTLGSILRERRLPLAEAVTLAVQVADALEEAHAKGIVHRDIKPANVMVTPRGQVKVLDFGLAKIATPPAIPFSEGDPPGPMTAPGTVMGTAEYMSPEQALGLEVDCRSDVFSFGSMFYEMVTGRRPFWGRTRAETLDRVIHAEPAALAGLSPDAPAALASVVGRCLAKDREQRYASGKELLAGLRELTETARSIAAPAVRTPKLPVAAIGAGAAALAILALAALSRRSPPVDPARTQATAPPPAVSAAAPERVRIAVLPFDDLGAGKDREYLADALTEETISALGQLDPDRVSVIGRTSVMTFRRTSKTLAQIGGELDATYLVESSIRAEANRVRVTAKLIRAVDQVQVWSAVYDSEPASMLDFQRELGTTIAEQIRLRLSPAHLAALTRRQTRNPEAYDLYLRGRHFWNQLTPATTRQAIDSFSRATAIAPDYALAWSGLADAYTSSPINGDAPPLPAWALARKAATQAVHAEVELAESQTSLGLVDFWFEWKWADAETEFRKAIALDPSYALAHRSLGILLGSSGRQAEAAQEMQRGRQLDPLDAMQHALSAQVAFSARDYPAAVEFARQAVVIAPEFWIAHFQLAQAYERLGKDAQALQAADDALRFSGGNSKTLSLRGYIFARQGRRDEAGKVLQTLAAAAHDRFVPPYAMALVHVGLGERDAALDWLERSFKGRDVHLVTLLIDPKWDGLRGEARFQDLLRRCGFAGPRASLPPK